MGKIIKINDVTFQRGLYTQFRGMDMQTALSVVILDKGDNSLLEGKGTPNLLEVSFELVVLEFVDQ